MALIKCKECKKEVSSSAKTCPHCGIKNPGVTAGSIVAGLGLLLVIGWIVVKCTGDSGDTTQAQVDDTSCSSDLKCWGDKNSVAAGVYCKQPVEQLGKYSAKWTDGALETKFSHYRWLDQRNGTLTYIGDKIEFQNGFGAFQAHTYECDYSPASKTVLAVRAQPGRL